MEQPRLRKRRPQEAQRIDVTLGSDDPQVLVVTHQLAQEVDGVIDFLRARGARVARWNACRFPDSAVALIGDGHIQLGGAELDTRRPITAWLHDIGAYPDISRSGTLAQVIAMRECHAFLHGLLDSLDARWLNSPERIRTASLKLYQLTMASRLGLRIPSYIATNSLTEVTRFSEEHGECIVKAVHGGYVAAGGESGKFYTRLLDDFSINGSGRYIDPVIIQKRVRRQCEIRTTVVGGNCFHVSCDLSDIEGVLADIRTLDYNSEKGRFSVFQSEELDTESLALAAALGLSYCGIDWAVSEDGSRYFLECNPLGAFRWYQEVSEMDITGAIGKHLLQLGGCQ